MDWSFWRFEEGFIRNSEQQYYRGGLSNNVSLTEEGITLTARKENVRNALYESGSKDWRRVPMFARYTSASMISREPFNGMKVEIVARIHDGTGAWPAIWLRGVNKVAYGEVDLLEQVGYRPNEVHSSYHLGVSGDDRVSVKRTKVVPDFVGKDISYVAVLDAISASVSVDGEEMFSVGRDVAYKGVKPLRQGFRLVANLALGGSWGGEIDDSALPATMTISSIKIWKLNEGAQNP